MEDLYTSIVPSILNGYLLGFKILWQSLIQHPALLIFLVTLIVLSKVTHKHIR